MEQQLHARNVAQAHHLVEPVEQIQVYVVYVQPELIVLQGRQIVQTVQRDITVEQMHLVVMPVWLDHLVLKNHQVVQNVQMDQVQVEVLGIAPVARLDIIQVVLLISCVHKLQLEQSQLTMYQVHTVQLLVIIQHPFQLTVHLAGGIVILVIPVLQEEIVHSAHLVHFQLTMDQ